VFVRNNGFKIHRGLDVIEVNLGDLNVIHKKNRATSFKKLKSVLLFLEYFN
jgi:hypothetical protein